MGVCVCVCVCVCACVCVIQLLFGCTQCTNKTRHATFGHNSSKCKLIFKVMTRSWVSCFWTQYTSFLWLTSNSLTDPHYLLNGQLATLQNIKQWEHVSCPCGDKGFHEWINPAICWTMALKKTNSSSRHSWMPFIVPPVHIKVDTTISRFV